LQLVKIAPVISNDMAARVKIDFFISVGFGR
jgi:hypothetical protein